MSDDCHSTYYFPINKSNENCFTPFNLYGLTSHFLSIGRAFEELQTFLFILSCPHYLDMTAKYDKIYFSSKYSHCNHMPLIENSSFQIFSAFQEDYHELYDPIAKWLEQSYLASSVRRK